MWTEYNRTHIWAAGLIAVFITTLFISFFSIPLSIAFIGGLCLLALLFKIPELIIALLLYSGSFKEAPFLNIVQSRIDITVLLVLLLIVYLLYRLITKPESLVINESILKFTLFSILITSINVFFFNTSDYGMDKYLKFSFIAIGCCLFLPYLFIKNIQSIERIFYFVLFLAASIGIYGIITNNRDSFAADYLFVGRISGAAVIICLFYLLNNFKSFGKLFIYLISAFFTYTIFFSGSRGPFVALIFSCLFGLLIILFSNFSYKALFKAAAILISIVIVFLICLNFSLIPAAFTENISYLLPWSGTSSLDTSLNARIDHISTSLYIISQHPLTGIGIGNYPNYLGTETRDYPHNIFLEIGCEFGLPVLFLLFLVLAVSYFRMLKMIAKVIKIDKKGGSMLVTICVLFTYLLLCAQFSSDLCDNRDWWFLIPLVYCPSIAISTLKERELP